MSSLPDLRKSLAPIREGLAQHAAELNRHFQDVHARYMQLNGKLRELRELPPHTSEVETVLDEFLRGFMVRQQEEFDRMTGPFRNADSAENRKATLQMLCQNPWPALAVLSLPTLDIGRAVKAMPWMFGPPPDERARDVASLEKQLQTVVAEMDEVSGLAESLGVRLER